MRSALAALLAGTALFAPVTAISARAEDARPVEQVIVTGYGSQVELVGDYAGGQIARGGRVGVFGNLDFMDTPFSLTTYTAKVMLDQQAQSVADVLRREF